MAESMVRSPWEAMTMVRPTVAELDWTSIVRTVPARTPSMG